MEAPLVMSSFLTICSSNIYAFFKENNDSVDGRNKQLSLNASISAVKDFDNQGFCYSEEEMNAHVDQQQLVSTNA